MTEIEELRSAARANLRLRDQREFERLLAGAYANDMDALRGFIWEMLEIYWNEEKTDD